MKGLPYTICLVLVLLQAQGQTLLHFRVNDSDAALVAGGTIPSVAGSDGTVNGAGGITLSTDVPTDGVPAGAGNRSFTGNGTAGAVIPGTLQLSNAAILAAGGFTYEAWFKWDGGGLVNSIIDYAGTEKMVRNTAHAGAGMLFNSAAPIQVLGDATAGTWHYAACVFTANAALEGDGSLGGTLTWYYDSAALAGSVAYTKSTFGDSLNRTIGVGMHPLGFGGDFFNGLIYEPRASLGALNPSQLLFTNGPAIEDFTATPDRLSSGESALLNWTISNSDGGRIDQGIGDISDGAGSTNVMPTVTTTYQLTTSNAAGTVTAEVTVFVDEPALDPVLNEILAENDGLVDDEDGDSPDWIELYNPNPFTLPIGGWSLSDDASHAERTTFQAGTEIPPLGYLLVFASGKMRLDPSGILHAAFRLENSGEYLALLRPDQSVASEFSPEYPKQFANISYGQTPADGLRYFPTPTPRAENDSHHVIGFVGDTQFSVDRGFFTNAFDTVITSSTPGASIVYTLDSSSPTDVNGTVVPAAGPTNTAVAVVSITQTSTLRARAILPNHEPSNTDTHTYIFTSDVILQSPTGTAPGDWPTGPVNNQVFDYGMDPNIVNHATWGPELEQALLDLPTLSIVTDQEHLTDPASGIYTHASNDGITWERPTSLEWLSPDGSSGFQVDAGLRMRGGFSRGGFNPKHSFRMFFRRAYGPSTLEFPLFSEEGPDEFDKIDLRTAQNYAWSNNTGNDELRNTFIREVFSRDCQRDLGQAYTRSAYTHLYLNGQYWGLYMTHERPESYYAQTYFGGNRDDYDVVKPQGGVLGAVDGTLDAWQDLHALATAGFETDTKFYAVQGKNPAGVDDPAITRHLDIDNLIDFMITKFFVADRDSPLTLGQTAPNNFYAARNRNPAARDFWRFYAHDSEHSMLGVNENYTGNTATGSAVAQFNPRWLSQQLAAHPLYRQRFADQVQAYFFENGPLTPTQSLARWNFRASQIERAIIAESARWGDQHNEPPLDKQTWLNELDWIRTSFLPARSDIVLDQLRTAGLFPNVAAPVLSQHGGHVSSPFTLTMTAPAGSIHYTLDGSDPREASALAYNAGSPPVISSQTQVRAATSDGGVWSAATEATFLVDTVPATSNNLVIAEIHYNPLPPTLAEDPGAAFSRNDMEFIEFLNISTQRIDLTQVILSGGIKFDFPAFTTLAPGERAVLVENEQAFAARYPGVAFLGQYGGRLSDGGDALRLTRGSEILADFAYDGAAPWPAGADGSGYSLTLRCPAETRDINDPSHWRSSAVLHGTPGDTDAISLAAWLAAEGLVDASGNPDADPFLNFAEYALGLNPQQPDQLPAALFIHPVTLLEGPTDFLFYAFTRRISADDVVYEVESSFDLEAWHPADTALVEVLHTGGVSETIVVRLREPLNVTTTPIYLRLRLRAKPDQ